MLDYCIFNINNKYVAVIYHCFCVGVAGCCAKTTIAPLDRVKILLQAQNPHYKHLGTLLVTNIECKELFVATRLC